MHLRAHGYSFDSTVFLNMLDRLAGLSMSGGENVSLYTTCILYVAR